MAASTRAPLWLPPAIAAIRRLPFGRYWLLHRLRRFVRRSFVARLAPDLGRFQFHCDLRDSVAAEACFTGWYEPQETRVCAHVLRPGSVFVDVGANWGYFSLVAAGLVGAAGRVVALEPEPRLFERLSSNVAMNGLRIVRPLQLAAPARAAWRSSRSTPRVATGARLTALRRRRPLIFTAPPLRSTMCSTREEWTTFS